MWIYTITLDDGSQFELRGYGWRSSFDEAEVILLRDYPGRCIVSVVRKGEMK